MIRGNTKQYDAEACFIDCIRLEGAHWNLNRRMVKAFDSYELAGYVAYLVDRYNYHLQKGTLCDGGGFYCKHEIQTEDLRHCEKKIRRFKKTLQDMEILNLKTFGLPAKEYYFINIKKLLNFVYPSPTHSGRNASTHSGRNNINTSININNNKLKINTPPCAQSAHEEVSVSLPLPSKPKKQLPRSWNTLNQQHPPEKVKALRDFYQLQKKQHPSVIGDVTPDSDYIQKGLETINKLERIDKVPWESIKLVLDEVPFHKFWKTVIIVFHACRNKSVKTGLTKFQNALIAIQSAANAENKKELSYAVACNYCYREFNKEIGQIFIDLLEERLFERPDRAPGGSWTEEEQATILKAAVDLSCHLESKQTAEALQNEYIPQDIYIMELFYYWLTHEDQQWIDCISSSCFKPTGKIVQKFLSWCAQDCGYDILTGDCVR